MFISIHQEHQMSEKENIQDRGLMMQGCRYCHNKIKYSNKHDSYYCDKCNEWLEEQCSDEYCNKCKSRPEKPMPVVCSSCKSKTKHSKRKNKYVCRVCGCHTDFSKGYKSITLFN